MPRKVKRSLLDLWMKSNDESKYGYMRVFNNTHNVLNEFSDHDEEAIQSHSAAHAVARQIMQLH